MMQPSNSETDSAAIEEEVPFKEKISRLIRLQEKDKEIDKLRAELESIPKIKEERLNALEIIVREQDETKQLIMKLTLERKGTEGELAKKEEEIRKHTGELQQVKSNDAYKALLAELENAKGQKDKLEDSILEILERIDEAKRNEGHVRKVFEEKKQLVEKEIAAIEEKKKSIEAALVTMGQERGELMSHVSQEILSRYERIRLKKGGLAIAPLLEGGSCGGCQMRFPQHVLNELLKGKDFVTCETCQRILFIPEKSPHS